ncbi:MAG: AraC family transcriptional regulator [Oscillospiraceae bacterium]
MYNAVYPILGNETKLPFYLSGIGRTSPEFHIKRDTGLCSHQFLFTVKGRGVLIVNDRKYTLEKNSLLYLPPELPHEYYPENDDWSTCWMVFRGDMLAGIMKKMGFDREMVAVNADLTAFEMLYNRILGLAADNLHNGKKCSLLIYDAVLLAGEIFDGRKSDDNTGNIIVDKAVEYINAHCCYDISLNELSELSSVSPQYFGRVFKERLNMRPMEYIARIKISKAKIMLLDSDLPVAAISEKLGYTSPTYFGIVFRKYEGISPSEFRKNRGTII